MFVAYLLESVLAADHLLEGQELERESPGSVEVVMKNLAPICYSLV